MFLFLHSLKLSGGKRKTCAVRHDSSLLEWDCFASFSLSLFPRTVISFPFFSMDRNLLCLYGGGWAFCDIDGGEADGKKKKEKKMGVSHYSDQQLVALLILVSWCFWTPCLVDLACSTIDFHSLSLSHHFSFTSPKHLCCPLLFSRHLYGSPSRHWFVQPIKPRWIQTPAPANIRWRELNSVPSYLSAPPQVAIKTIISYSIPIPAWRRECTNNAGVYRNRFMVLLKSWLQFAQMRLQMLFGATNRRQ